MRDSRRVSIFAIILFEVLISTGQECEQVSGLVVSLPGGWYAMTQCPCRLILNAKKVASLSDIGIGRFIGCLGSLGRVIVVELWRLRKCQGGIALGSRAFLIMGRFGLQGIDSCP